MTFPLSPTGAQEFMREHEKAMEHNDKVLAQQEGGDGAEVCINRSS